MSTQIKTTVKGKQATLMHWASMIGRRQNPLKEMEPIPYRSKGSKYGACGIRIDGTPEFIDAVLSNLTDLLDGENSQTRLELSRQPVQPTKINGQTKSFENAAEDAEVCYIRLHERGNESKMVHAMLDAYSAPRTEPRARQLGLAPEILGDARGQYGFGEMQ